MEFGFNWITRGLRTRGLDKHLHKVIPLPYFPYFCSYSSTYYLFQAASSMSYVLLWHTFECHQSVLYYYVLSFLDE